MTKFFCQRFWWIFSDGTWHIPLARKLLVLKIRNQTVFGPPEKNSSRKKNHWNCKKACKMLIFHDHSWTLTWFLTVKMGFFCQINNGFGGLGGQMRTVKIDSTNLNGYACGHWEHHVDDIDRSKLDIGKVSRQNEFYNDAFNPVHFHLLLTKIIYRLVPENFLTFIFIEKINKIIRRMVPGAWIRWKPSYFRTSEYCEILTF